jgi:small-conductance mechanosensitive channel
MEYLQQEYLNNTLEAWIVAAGIMLAAYVLLVVLLRFLAGRIEKMAAKTDTTFDDLLATLLRSVRWYVAMAWGAYAGMQTLAFDPRAGAIAGSLVVLFTLLQSGIWGNHIIGFWIGRAMKERVGQDSASATTMAGMRFVARLLLIAVLVLVGLDNLGVDITALVAGLGVGGIAVALAVQNILSDLFASLSIILDKPFQIGDFIIIGDYMGTVEHIGLKTTRIRSLSGEQIIFSNADLLGSRIRNYKRMNDRRVLFSIGVTYQTTEEQLKAIPVMLKDVISKHEKARFDRAHFKNYADSSLNFEIVYYVLSSDYAAYMDIQQEINLEIYSRFAKEGIGFAYPTQTVFVAREADGTS